MERVRIIIHGRVQGVFFRSTAIKEANRLGLSGYVRNRADGTVEAVAEGQREELEQFVAWCRHGPTLAHVERVDISWEEAHGAPGGFSIA